MHRWVSLSSSARRMRARFACCSTGSSTSSSAIRGSSCRTGPTSNGSSASWSNGAADCWPEPSPRSTACSSASPSWTARGEGCSGRQSGPSSSVGWPRVTRPEASASPAMRMHWDERLPSSTAPSSTRRTSASRSPQLFAAYRAELDRLAAWDRGALRRRAIERLTGDLDSWGGAPVYAHGFEDLTGAEWRLLEALAARTDVHVSLPYEPGRPAYASLRRTVDDLALLADGDVVELPSRSARVSPAGARAHRTRALLRVPGSEPARLLPALPRGRGWARNARARRGRGPRPRAGRRRRGRDRRRLPVRRERQAGARGGVRLARRPARVRGSRRSADNPVRARPARPAPLCLAGRASDRSCTRTFARRTPASRAGTSTGSRAACAGAAWCGAIARAR